MMASSPPRTAALAAAAEALVPSPPPAEEAAAAAAAATAAAARPRRASSSSQARARIGSFSGGSADVASFGSGILAEQLDFDTLDEEGDGDDDARLGDDGAERGEAAPQQRHLQPAAANDPSARRVYYLDWLRIVSIYLVFMYHCIQYLAEVQVWEGAETRAVVAYKCFALQIGMPVFFHISGRAQALARPAALRKTVVRRLQRLLLPFLACYILLIPPWQFARLPTLDPENWSPDVHPEIPRHYPMWLLWFVRNKFSIDVGWLWFLPALFLVSVFNAPLFLFAELQHRRYAAIVFASWAVAAATLCALRFSLAFVFFTALGPLVAMAVVVHVPFPGPAEAGCWSPRRWVAVQVVTWVQLAAQVGLVCSFRYADMKEGPIPAGAKPLPALILFFGLYSQGYFVQRWSVDEGTQVNEPRTGDVEMLSGLNHGQEPQPAVGHCQGLAPAVEAMGQTPGFQLRTKCQIWARLWNAVLGGFLILAMSLGNSLGEFEEELFPIYSASFLDTPYFGAVHVLGTWAYIGITVPWFKAHLDDEIHPAIYRHASASTMLAYLFHSLFIVFVVFWVVKPLGLTHGLWKVLDPILTLLVAVGACQGIYALLLRAPKLGVLFGL